MVAAACALASALRSAPVACGTGWLAACAVLVPAPVLARGIAVCGWVVVCALAFRFETHLASLLSVGMSHVSRFAAHRCVYCLWHVGHVMTLLPICVAPDPCERPGSVVGCRSGHHDMGRRPAGCAVSHEPAILFGGGPSPGYPMVESNSRPT